MDCDVIHLTMNGLTLEQIFQMAQNPDLAPVVQPIINAMTAGLRNAGYVVCLPRDWESPGTFCDRLGICRSTLIRKLRDPRCPHADLQRANHGKGRLKLIASNPVFEAFVLDGKPTAHDSTAAPAIASTL